MGTPYLKAMKTIEFKIEKPRMSKNTMAKNNQNELTLRLRMLTSAEKQEIRTSMK